MSMHRSNLAGSTIRLSKLSKYRRNASSFIPVLERSDAFESHSRNNEWNLCARNVRHAACISSRDLWLSDRSSLCSFHHHAHRSVSRWNRVFSPSSGIVDAFHPFEEEERWTVIEITCVASMSHACMGRRRQLRASIAENTKNMLERILTATWLECLRWHRFRICCTKKFSKVSNVESIRTWHRRVCRSHGVPSVACRNERICRTWIDRDRWAFPTQRIDSDSPHGSTALTIRHGKPRYSSVLRIFVSLLASRLFLHRYWMRLQKACTEGKETWSVSKTYLRTGIAFLSKRSSARL